MFGIGMGPSGPEKTQFNNLTGTSDWATNQGKEDLTSSTDFMKSIISGDPEKIGQVLGPQIKAIQGQGQQQKQTNAQFGNRGGGTNASNQMIDDKVTEGVNDLISSLTGSAVSGLNRTGMNLVNTGMSGNIAGFGEAKTMQDQNAKKWDDIFKSIASTVGAVAGIPGIPGGLAGNTATTLNSINAQFGF